MRLCCKISVKQKLISISRDIIIQAILHSLNSVKKVFWKWTKFLHFWLVFRSFSLNFKPVFLFSFLWRFVYESAVVSASEYLALDSRNLRNNFAVANEWDMKNMNQKSIIKFLHNNDFANSIEIPFLKWIEELNEEVL